MFFRTYKNRQFRKLFYINNHHSYQKTFQENMEITDWDDFFKEESVI